MRTFFSKICKAYETERDCENKHRAPSLKERKRKTKNCDIKAPIYLVRLPKVHELFFHFLPLSVSLMLVAIEHLIKILDVPLCVNGW